MTVSQNSIHIHLSFLVRGRLDLLCIEHVSSWFGIFYILARRSRSVILLGKGNFQFYDNLFFKLKGSHSHEAIEAIEKPQQVLHEREKYAIHINHKQEKILSGWINRYY